MTKLMMNQFQKRNQFHIMNRFLQRNRFLLKTIPFAKGIDSFKKCQKWPKNRNCDSFGIGIDTALFHAEPVISGLSFPCYVPLGQPDVTTLLYSAPKKSM